MPDPRVTWYLPAGSGDCWPDDYERGRPGWPPEVVDIPGLPSAATVLDLGAGTGKLTRLLTPAFGRVVAVEPQDAMRRMLDALCPDAEVLAGTAEQTPLADASVDAVFVAEAFHLLGNERSVVEIARVLRPAGMLVLMWNLPMGPWEPSIAAVDRLLHKRLPKTQELGYDPLDLNPRRYASGEWRQAFAASPFEELQETRLPNPQTLDRDGLVAFLASMGWIADLPDVDRLPLLERVRSLLDAAEYRRSWETRVHWTRLSKRQRTSPHPLRGKTGGYKLGTKTGSYLGSSLGEEKRRMNVRVSHAAQPLERAVEVGDIVRDLRKCGLTAGEIGKAVGVTERAVRNWKAAGAPRRKQEARIFTLRDIVVLLHQTLSPRGIGQWLRAPNRLLAGRRPLDVLAEGEADVVRDAAASYVEGSYA